MGDPPDDRVPSFCSLPPGCRFYPSDEQLLCYYLTNKNTNLNSDGNFYGFNAITELNLYDYEPFELPDDACFAYGYGGRKRHWYCYTVRMLKESVRRSAKGGYWRRKGRARDVVGMGGKVVVGTRTRFAFYLGNSLKSAVRTDWTMYEYALVGHHKASFVLCRVLVKFRGGNSLSEHGLSSCAEESVSAVRHVGIQHDGVITSDTVKVKVCDDSAVDRKNEISRHLRLANDNEVNDRVKTVPVSIGSLQPPTGTPPTERVRSSGQTGSGEMLVEPMTRQQLLSILEEDFIELDDLVGPYLGNDYLG